MENFAIITLVEELKKATDGMVVRRVVGLHPGGVLLQTRSVKIPALKIWLDGRNPILYVSGNRPPIESVATEFLLSLRKHLNSARLVGIEKPLSERIVELTFRTSLPAQELETVSLVVELLPNAPNLFLLDQRRRVLDWFAKPNPRRALAEYDEYRYPRVDKVDLEVVLGEDHGWFDEDAFRKDTSSWLIQTIAGIGPVFAAEIAHRLHGWGDRPIEELKRLVRQLQTPSETTWVYSERPLSNILEQNDIDALRRSIVTPIELTSLGAMGSQTYPGMLEAIKVVADELGSRTLLETVKAPTRRRMRDQSRRVGNHRRRLLERHREYVEATDLQKSAQLLASSGADMDRCYESLDVTDYFEQTPRTRTLALNPSKTLRDNVSGMFKRHQKAQRGIRLVEDQLSALEVVERRLRAEEHRIQSIGDWNAWLAFSEAEPRKVRSDRPADRQPRPRRRRSIQIKNHEVFVGRNGRENDELTFKVATGDDFWFHVADYTGSHVIVRNPTKQVKLDEELLLRAAELAAYYSQARNSRKVDVHYTQRKFVSKPRKAKPGLVRLREFKTIAVEPRGWVPSENHSEAPVTHKEDSNLEVGTVPDEEQGVEGR